MDRRRFVFLGSGIGSLGWPDGVLAQEEGVREPIREPHFPSRLYQFVWRNWELANTDRMSMVLATSEKNVLELGRSMGLPKKRRLSVDQSRRLYITVIRQNWHLLPEQQIIELLRWDRERFEFTLKEDDFLSVKLGGKPRCPKLVYQTPSRSERVRASQIRTIVRQVFGSAIDEKGEELFHFVRALSESRYPLLRNPSSRVGADEVDLTDGWTLSIPDRKTLAEAAERLRTYMRTAMEAKLEISRGSATASKTIRLRTNPDRITSADGFEVRITAEGIRISGHDEAGVLRGIYWLQDQMETREGPFLPIGTFSRSPVWSPRHLYSYFALYGDPLMETDIDPFPDAYLEKLARVGINGVWLQAVLNNLAPSADFPEFGKGWETRLANLNALVKRAGRFGIRVYLYLNEPRAMPPAFFENRAGLRGEPHRGLYSLCTSTPVVRKWIAESLAHVTGRVPDLGGWFSISMSENHTNCFSHGGAWGKRAPVAKECPRCSQRSSWDVLAELFRTFRDGIRKSGSSADLILWDWGWGDELAGKLIPLLPKDAKFQSISEWRQPVERGGVKTTVGEYSISVVGPGPRATRNWALARQNGLETMAKVQFNNTWEISAVPYIPVPQLVAQHCENLRRTPISGIMASWTLGGYPSPNLMVAKRYQFGSAGSIDESLAKVARQRYGDAAASQVVAGWKQLSQAFQEFPYGVRVYFIPTQHGPANLLRFQPTGYRPGMILFPYDDVDTWSGAYPPQVMLQQFRKMASLWGEGLAILRAGLRKTSGTRRHFADKDLAVAETCLHHFQSTANQVEFYLLRVEQNQSSRARMRSIAEEEIEIAKRQFSLARKHSEIAYEASNHYYYTPLDLVEKVLNCRRLIDQVIQ